jgi:sphingolipid 4-desaturase/C4-monooxygenase
VQQDYIRVETPSCHISRKKEILKKYPSVTSLQGPYFPSFFWTLGLVLLQWTLAAYMGHQSVGWILATSFLVGAFINHALYVLMHECGHNMVFKKTLANRLLGLVCDFALLIPGSQAFRKFHNMHHRYLGEYHGDPDIVSHFEARLVGNSWWKKILWITFFWLSQALRPTKLKSVQVLDTWVVINFLTQLIVNASLLYFFGWGALLYLGLSTFFALGLHPLGGRWIQEHYVTKEGQETYSYYGPLNLLTFNMGYHNEHHDFLNIPWVNLPKLKKLAPEFYEPLKSYNSWLAVLWKFISDSKMSSYTRIVHPDKIVH